MATNILSIGQSALNAAQLGMSTTGHNIANASTAGYSRQSIVQSTAQAQNMGFGYIGQGTIVTNITRAYDALLAKQVNNGISSTNNLTTYGDQMSQIDTILSDASAGLTPVMQDFFSSLKSLSANASDTPSRQALLSDTQSLINRFASTNDTLNQLRDGVNSQLTSSAGLVNSYATQISKLNDLIEKAVNSNGSTPNDLMDQRDKLISDLSAEVKTTVVDQGNGSYNVFIGTGLPLVVGGQTYALSAIPSPTDASQIELAYQGSSGSMILSADNLTGGNIGGVLQFRTESLDSIQNQIGQIATVLAYSLNDQMKQGVDSSGNLGGNLINISAPVVNTSSLNHGNGVVTASISSASALTSSDYQLKYDGSNYTITRLSDKQVVSTSSSLPQTVDGVKFDLSSGTMQSGDSYLIEPTRNAASSLSLAITDVSKLALAGALNTAKNSANTGSATISAATTNSSYSSNALSSALNITYDNSTGTFSGFPAAQAVTVTVGSTSTTYPAGTAVPYTSGASISVGGFSFSISGTPSNGDQFSITPNDGTTTSDNRNALLLVGLQTQKTMNNGSASFTSALGQVVTAVGNKTRELQVSATAEQAALTQTQTSMESVSGVNLDEEATNLLRYQQAYQAAGKMMQIANQMFDTILSIGN